MSLNNVSKGLSGIFNSRALRTTAKAAAMGVETLALLTEIGAVTAVAPAALLAVAGAAVLVGAVVASGENKPTPRAAFNGVASRPALATAPGRLAVLTPQGLRSRSNSYIR